MTEHLWGVAKVESCSRNSRPLPAFLLSQDKAGLTPIVGTVLVASAPLSSPSFPSWPPEPMAFLISSPSQKIQAQPLFLKQLFSSAHSPREVQNFTRANPCPQGAHSFFLESGQHMRNIWRTKMRDFPGGPVVQTLCFQCRGHGFNPWSGNLDPCMPHSVAKIKLIRNKGQNNNKDEVVYHL